MSLYCGHPQNSAPQLWETAQNSQHDNEIWKSTIMYNDIKDIPASHNTAPLENTPPTHSIPEQAGEETTKYSNDSNPQFDLAELQEHFQQL